MSTALHPNGLAHPTPTCVAHQQLKTQSPLSTFQIHQLLLTHYGLRLAPDLELLPSISRLKRLDFIVHAQRAAKKFGAELIYTWLPQSAALGSWMGYPVVLEMHADNSGKLGVWWMRQFWNQKTPKVMTVTTSALRKALERSTKFQFKDEAS